MTFVHNSEVLNDNSRQAPDLTLQKTTSSEGSIGSSWYYNWYVGLDKKMSTFQDNKNTYFFWLWKLTTKVLFF